VRLWISADDASVVRIKRDFETWLGDVDQSPSYKWFARRSDIAITLYVGLLAVLAWICVGIAVDGFALTRPVRAQGNNADATLLGIAVVIAVEGLVLHVLVKFVNHLRRTYWPVGVFLIGNGAKRYEDMTSRRNLWFLAIWIPLLLAVGIPLIFSHC